MARLKSILGFVNWPSFLLAGLVANIAKAIAFLLVGKSLVINGAQVLPDAEPLVQDLVGAGIFIFSGQVFYALVYIFFFHNAKGFASNKLWDLIVKALAVGFAEAFLSIVVMPYSGDVSWLGAMKALFGYVAFAFGMVFVYKSPAEKQAKEQAKQQDG